VRMSGDASQAFSIAHCTDLENLPKRYLRTLTDA